MDIKDDKKETDSTAYCLFLYFLIIFFKLNYTFMYYLAEIDRII